MTGPRLVPVLLDFSVLTGEQHPQPRIGEVGAYELAFISALSLGRVRGMIRRLWTVHSRRDVAVDPERMETWPPAWGSTTLTPVEEMPMVAHGQPWPALLPDQTYTGLLGDRAPGTRERGGGVGR